MENELIEIKNLNPEELFTIVGIKPIIEMVKQKVKDFVPDMTTEEGKKEIISMSARVCKSKTLIESIGAEYSASIKVKTKAIDAARKLAFDELEALQKEIRRPITELEQKEKMRVEKHALALKDLESLLVVVPQSVTTCEFHLNEIQKLLTSRDWQEFSVSATKLSNELLARFTEFKVKLVQQEKDKIELEASRKKIEDMERAERERKIAEEAALKAQKEAEERSKKEIQKIEYLKQEAELKFKRAEQEKENAIQQERLRVQRSNEALKLEQDKRNADVENQRKINSIIVKVLVSSCSCDEEQARMIVTKIVKGEIPNVSIKY